MRRVWQSVAAVAAAPVVAGVIVGCGSTSGSPGAPPAANPSAARTAAPRAVSYNLYTHCGIYYARIGTRYYVATHPLSDGSGNPPAGWANPYQPGTMTLVPPAEAVFTDKAGHRVVFRLATPGRGKMTVRVCA